MITPISAVALVGSLCFSQIGGTLGLVMVVVLLVLALVNELLAAWARRPDVDKEAT